MDTFIMAMTVNPNAKRLQPALSHQVNESLKVFAKRNVELLNFYATMGRYDYLAIFRAADQTVAFRAAAEINSQGVLDSETWPVIPYESFSHLIEDIQATGQD